MMEVILSSHKLVLSSFVVEELKAVVQRKFPAKTAVVDDLLAKMSFDLVYTPEQINEKLFYIRDEKDYPVLYTAMIEDVDILITGDKDFAEIEVERPEILTPAEFMDTYLK
jgi:predicted nucleic acid-binding protein